MDILQTFLPVSKIIFVEENAIFDKYVIERKDNKKFLPIPLA